MPLLHVIILAVIQGIAEFLPISSSGHLVVVAALLGGQNGAEDLDVTDVNIVLHMGTLASILVFYWHRLWRLLTEDRQTIPRLIVATIPVVVVGFTVKIFFEDILSSPLLAGCMLIVTGAILLTATGFPRGDLRYQQLSFRQAWLLGMAQSVAVLPGVSRSGTTISAGMGLGLARRDAAAFSFLMAVPAIGGASLLEIRSLIKDSAWTTSPLNLGVGAVVAFLVGLVALWWLLRWLESGRFERFAYWCVAVGLGVVVWQLS